MITEHDYLQAKIFVKQKGNCAHIGCTDDKCIFNTGFGIPCITDEDERVRIAKTIIKKYKAYEDFVEMLK